MATNPIARLGDGSTHGGQITTASDTTVEGKRVARVGDTLACPIHGNQTITTGSPQFTCDGKQVARSTSETTCGAVIIGGATRTSCE